MQKLSFDDPIAKTLTPQMCDSIARRIHSDIDAYCVATMTDEHRTHLGASIIGDECSRRIWYSFRWIRTEIFDGRMLRLFNRGHLEETRVIGWLRGIGCTVYETDPVTGRQFRIVGVNGHYGGSTDAVGALPYPELIGLNLLLEFKTHNAGSFKYLLANKLVIGRPKHYAQMCSYGVAFGLQYGMYIGVGKNDDDLYIEIVKLDAAHADDLVRKAHDIITSEVPPPKISMQPTHFECKYCPHLGPCHHGELADKNCRSCRHAIPDFNAEWFCRRHNGTIPKEFIRKGCSEHYSII